MRLSLRAKILLLIAGTASGLVSVILLAFTLLVSREMGRAVREDVRATGGVLGQLMRERSAVLLDQSRLIADQPVLRAALSTHDPATVLDQARDYQRQMGVDEIIVTDRDGHVLGDTDGQARTGTDLSRDPGVAAALDSSPGRASWRAAGRLMLAVCVPVRIGAYPWGTFTAYRAIDPAVAAHLRASLGTDVAFLYQGRVVGASCPLPARLPTPQVPTVVTLGRHRASSRSTRRCRTPIPSAGMGFVTLRPYGPAMAPVPPLPAGVPGRVGAHAAAGPGRRRLRGAGPDPPAGRRRPGRRDAAARGAGRSGFEVRRTDEIGLLQTVFNEMTVSLRGSQERLLALIDADPLTGLDNHRRFQERLAQEARRCARSGESLSLLLLDLDHFGQYNQRHGHAAGDQAVLRCGRGAPGLSARSRDHGPLRRRRVCRPAPPARSGAGRSRRPR